MSLQDDIGAAIVLVLQASPFTSYLGAVGYGWHTSAAGKDSNGVCVVAPVGSESGEVLDDSRRNDYIFHLHVSLADRSAHTRFTGLMHSIAAVFNPASRTLQASFTNTSGKALTPTLVPSFSQLEPERDNPNAPDLLIEVTVTTWSST